MSKNKASSEKTIKYSALLIAIIALGAAIYFFSFKEPVSDTVEPKSNPTAANSRELKPATDDKQATETESPTSTDPLTYSDDKQLFTVSKEEFTILNKFNAANLAEKSKECGTNKTEEYFKEILSKYSADDKGIIYNFKYNGNSQDPDTWTVAVIPNKTGYADLEHFKADFNLCEAGADRYPAMISEKYLLFKSSCGTGFDDGSENPHGCDIVQQAVSPTIKLN